VVLLLVAGGIATWLWVLTHWFVGVATADAGDRVAVYRGFNTALLGLDLYRVDDVTDIDLDDLSSYDRNSVRQGIEADDADDAQRIVDDLHDATLPPCETKPSTPSADAPPSTETSLSPIPDGDLPSPDTGALPTQAGPGSSTEAAPSSGTPTSSPEPGVDCREAE
jgi:PPM family protein phosphatase